MKPCLVNNYLTRCVGRTLRMLQCCWQAIRQLSGDDGYERYLAQHDAHPQVPALSRKAWFAQQQHQKWSGIKRCC